MKIMRNYCLSLGIMLISMVPIFASAIAVNPIPSYRINQDLRSLLTRAYVSLIVMLKRVNQQLETASADKRMQLIMQRDRIQARLDALANMMKK